MQKVSVTLLVLILSFAGLSDSALASTPKAGATCTKLGSTSIVKNIKFKCIKVNKKLVWHNDVAIKKTSQKPTIQPTPSPTPSPSPSPTSTQSPKPSFKAPIPISLPVAQTGAITFENVMNHVSEIPQTAWQRIQDVIKSNTPVNLKTDIYLAPNTRLDVAGGVTQFQNILQRNAQLWSGFSQSPYLSVYIYNAQDEPLAEQKLLEVYASRGYVKFASDGPINAMRNNCSPAIQPGQTINSNVDCGGANAGSVRESDEATMEFSQQNTFRGDYSGTVAHEYTHTVQGGQWINDPLCKNLLNGTYIGSAPGGNGCFRNGMANKQFSPCWLFEGLPQGTGYMAAYSDFPGYLNMRKTLPFNQGPTTITDYSANSLRDYLLNQTAPSCYDNFPLYKLGYSVGALTVEALTAIAGPQSVMAIYSLGAEGEDFPTAFQHVYGISWSDASTILSNVLASEYATYGPPPK